MSFLTNLVSSALTPSGFNANQAATAAQGVPQSYANQILAAIYKSLLGSANTANRLAPMQDSALTQYLQMLTPGGAMASEQGARQGFLQNALASLPALRQVLSQGGAGIGSLQGAELNTVNSARKAGNDLFSQLFSGQGIMDRANVIQGIDPLRTGLGRLSSLANVTYGRPTPQMGPSPLSGLAQGVGMASTAGLI